MSHSSSLPAGISDVDKLIAVGGKERTTRGQKQIHFDHLAAQRGFSGRIWFDVSGDQWRWQGMSATQADVIIDTVLGDISERQPALPADGDTVTVVSRQQFERKVQPELVQVGERVYVNLGAGMLAEMAAEMVLSQYPGAEVVRSGLDEVLLWHESAAATKYERMRVIVMVSL